jgi:hypothetical protein
VTLILATIYEHDILVTVDGLSVSGELSGASGRSTLQKVFPSPLHPVAIAQCGKNFIDVHCRRGPKRENSQKRSFEQWLSVFFDRCDLNDIAGVARNVRDLIRLDDPGFFGDVYESQLWVFGFSQRSERPEFYGVGQNGVQDQLEDEALPFNACMGAGARFLDRRDWRSHLDAFQHASDQQGKFGNPVFGGHIHQLRITLTGCRWTRLHEPMRGTLGFGVTLGRWKAKVITDETSDTPRCTILSLRRVLVDGLCRRALVGGRRHPKTYRGAKEHWRAASQPNWDLADHLIAAHDDAELATTTDVSPEDACHYAALIQQILDSLPPEVAPDG